MKVPKRLTIGDIVWLTQLAEQLAAIVPAASDDPNAWRKCFADDDSMGELIKTVRAIESANENFQARVLW